MRRSPLARKTPLTARTPLPRRTSLRAAEKPRKPPRDTGPSRKVRALVLARDDRSCVCCGLSVIGQDYDLQHRDSRGMGGSRDPLKNLPPNLLTMLRRHHQRVESRSDPEDNAKGYWLRMGEDPLSTPVMVFRPGGSGFTAWPTLDGRWVTEGPAGGRAA